MRAAATQQDAVARNSAQAPAQGPGALLSHFSKCLEEKPRTCVPVKGIFIVSYQASEVH
jgi:hypothetical protein